MPPEQSLRRAVGKSRPLGKRIDLGPCLDLRQLIGGGKGTRRRIEHFAQLQLPGMQVESAQQIGHHVDGQDADRQLVLDAQPLGDRAVQVTRPQSQFVRQRFG